MSENEGRDYAESLFRAAAMGIKSLLFIPAVVIGLAITAIALPFILLNACRLLCLDAMGRNESAKGDFMIMAIVLLAPFVVVRLANIAVDSAFGIRQPVSAYSNPIPRLVSEGQPASKEQPVSKEKSEQGQRINEPKNDVESSRYRQMVQGFKNTASRLKEL